MEEKIFSEMDQSFSYKYIIPLVKVLSLYHRHEVVGLQNVPKRGRVIIVINHSLATYDGIILGAKIHLHTQRIPYGLADHQLFRFEFIKKFTEKLFIEGTMDNAKKVLNNEGLLMLAPGGMKEAIRDQSEKYQIKWENRKGFIKLAIETQTPIILAACPMADDIYNVTASKFTNFIYENIKIPFVYPKGVYNTILPKPIKLIHQISQPINPPSLSNEEVSDDIVEEFHSRIVKEMNQMLIRR